MAGRHRKAGTTLLDVDVTYSTQNGTAVAPDDYQSTTAVVTIPAGQTSTEITVPVVDDPNQEPDENFTVELSNAVNAAISATNGVGTVTIEYNDVPGRPAL